MNFTYEYSKKFLRDIKDIKKGEPQRIKQINKIVKQIIIKPSNLPREKIKGYNFNVYRYELGKKYRLTIKFENNHIIFLRVGRHENFKY